MDTKMADRLTNKESLPLSLRPIAQQYADADTTDEYSIAALLHRIGRQRGSFRNFTEESLLKELEELQAPVSGEDQEMSDMPEQENITQSILESNQDALHEAKLKDEQEGETTDDVSDTAIRDQVVQLVAAALNESALALDFTSLLLSSSRQAAAESMSPALKAAVPAGSLSHTRVRRPPSSRQPEPTSTILGFKARGLTSASNALSTASTQANKNYETDGIFWSEVQALIAAGWNIFKPKSAQPGIAVKFGPLPRHYALLDKDSQGHIDATKFEEKSAFLQLSIKRNGKVLLKRREESAAGMDLMDDEPAILRHLRKARKSLLNSSIYDDLVKEARDSANLGLSIVDRLITIPLGRDSQVCIELLESDAESNSGSDPSNDTEMSETTSASTHDTALLCSLAALIYSRYTSKAKTHPLRTFISCQRHGRLTATLQDGLDRLVAGLSALEWTIKPACSMTHAEYHDWDRPASTNIHLTFLTRELVVSIETTLNSVTTLLVVSSSMSATGTPVIQRQSKTHDPQRVLQLIMCELMEATQEVLSLTNGIVRCAEDAVRINDNVITMKFTKIGQIRLVKNGQNKIVQSNLALEILDFEGYEA